MARGKKKETLTPEERLQAALVPESEQPYKVPENWCWVTLESATSIIMGQSPSGTDTTEDSQYTPLVGGAADMGDIYPKATRYTKIPTKVSTHQDLILCIRATLGKPVYSDKEYCLGRGVAAIRPHIGDRSFYKYFFNAFEQYLYDNATGTTFAQVSSQTLQKMPLPLPPLDEQQRIVDRIENLFDKLDEAKQKAQNALDSFENRKAAILHKAFTGELTAQWRKEHGVGMESWEQHQFREILDVRDGTHDSPTYFDEGFPLITSKNLKDGRITDKDLKFISKEDYEKINERSKVDVGDILFAMIGTIGNPVVVEAEPKFAIKNVALFKNIGKVSPYFIKYFLESKEVVDQMEKDAKGSTQKFVSLGYLRAFNILLPRSGEQIEIVRILDELLTKEQQAKEAAEGVLEQIDLIKKSILARAFRGELGTNNPKEESSISLLKEIIFSAPPKKVTSRSDKPVEVEIPIAIQKQLTTAVQEKVYRYVLENPFCTIEQVSVIEKNVLEAVQALRELEEKSLILQNPKDDTLAVVI